MSALLRSVASHEGVPPSLGGGRCPYCGGAALCEILEVYLTGEFDLDTCCEGMRDEVAEFMQHNPKAGGAWLSKTTCHDGFTLSELCGHSLRRVIDGGGQLLLDWQLQFRKAELREVKAFIKAHHAHCAPPAGWKFGTALTNGPQTIAAVSVGRCVARALDQKRFVEANRVCVRRDVAPDLVWNACSMLYGWAAREAKKRGYERIYTYTLEEEEGTSLIAAGYVKDGIVKARRNGWSSKSRPRDASRTPNCNKVRWVKILRRPTGAGITRAISRSSGLETTASAIIARASATSAASHHETNTSLHPVLVP